MLPLELQLQDYTLVPPLSWGAQKKKKKPTGLQAVGAETKAAQLRFVKFVTFVPEFVIKAMGKGSFQGFGQIKKSSFPQPPKV